MCVCLIRMIRVSRTIKTKLILISVWLCGCVTVVVLLLRGLRQLFCAIAVCRCECEFGFVFHNSFIATATTTMTLFLSLCVCWRVSSERRRSKRILITDYYYFHCKLLPRVLIENRQRQMIWNDDETNDSDDDDDDDFECSSENAKAFNEICAMRSRSMCCRTSLCTLWLPASMIK